MKDPEHHQVLAVESVLKNILSAEYVQDQLPVFFAACERPTDSGMSGEDLGSCDDRVGDGRGQLRRSA